MTAAAQKQVAEKALALPRKARERLAKQLWKSLEPAEERISRRQWNGAWKVELDKRITDIESGRVKGISHAEARKRWNKILGKV